MLNLLPEQQKKMVLAEYHRRLAITVCVFVIVISLLAIIMLVPSFLVANTRYDRVVEKQNLINSEMSQLSGDDSTTAVKEIGERIAALSPLGAMTEASDVFDGFNALITNGIEITNYEYLLNKDQTVSFTVQGTAETREELVAFADVVEKSGKFTGAKVPLSSLRTDKNVPFNFKLSLTTSTSTVKATTTTP